MNGRNSDGGNLWRSPLKKTLEKNSLDLQRATPLPGLNIDMPYVLKGDDAFPLTITVIKPFPQSNLTMEKRVFNYRSSRSRRISKKCIWNTCKSLGRIQTTIWP